MHEALQIAVRLESMTNQPLRIPPPFQYRDRLNEIRVLKIKLNDLKRELHILKSSVANIDVLKREVHVLGRELLQERTKVSTALHFPLSCADSNRVCSAHE